MKVNDNVRTSCPVCGARDGQDTLFIRDYKGMHEIVPFSSYEVRECSHCGMIYAGNIVRSMPMGEYYSRVSKYTNDAYRVSGELVR